MKRTTNLTTLALAVALLAPMAARAETPERPNHDRARTFLVVRLAEELNLSDEKAVQVSAILRRSEDRRRELADRRDEVEKQIRAGLERKPPEDADLAKLVAQANDLDAQLSQISESSYREVQKVLTVEQQARLVLYRPKLKRQVRGIIRQRLEGDRPGRGSGRDGGKNRD